MIRYHSYFMKGSLIGISCLFFAQPEGVCVPASPLQNYCPVVIVNRSGLDADQIYFVSHGNDPDGIPCFLVPDGSGICQIVYPTPSGTPSSASSSKTLAQLPLATGTGITDSAYLIYLPINSASRGYFSFNSPMYLATTLNPQLGVLGIDDSSVTSLSDPNFYTFYQDFEFGLVQPNINNSTSEIFINLSWVDYFCLPMQLYMLKYPSNNPISIQYSALPAGTSASQTRDQIIASLNTYLSPYSTSWGTLGIPFYTNPYSDSTPTTYLRILAAKNSLALGDSTNQFVGAKVPQEYFPSNYVSNSASGPLSGKSFLQAVYDYYNSGNKLYAKIYPANLATAVYEIKADPSNLVLQLNGTGGAPSYTLDLSLLTMQQLLSGANSGAAWPYTPTTGAAYTNELSKLISALFTIGQLPFTASATSLASPFDNSQYNSSGAPGGYSQLSYYGNPPTYSNGPWYNVYGNGLHTLLISQGQVPIGHNPTLGLGYAYDYDDLLNLAGLTALDIQNQYGNPFDAANASKPFVVITLEQVNAATIPDISQDAYNYPVTVGSAPNGVDVGFTYFNGTSTLTTSASTTTTTSLGTVHVDATHPFQVTFSFDSVDYTYNINLQRQIVTPSTTTSTYNVADQHYQGSFTFTVSGSQGSPEFTLNYNSFPPPWPG